MTSMLRSLFLLSLAMTQRLGRMTPCFMVFVLPVVTMALVVGVIATLSFLFAKLVYDYLTEDDDTAF